MDWGDQDSLSVATPEKMPSFFPLQMSRRDYVAALAWLGIAIMWSFAIYDQCIVPALHRITDCEHVVAVGGPCEPPISIPVEFCRSWDYEMATRVRLPMFWCSGARNASSWEVPVPVRYWPGENTFPLVERTIWAAGADYAVVDVAVVVDPRSRGYVVRFPFSPPVATDYVSSKTHYPIYTREGPEWLPLRSLPVTGSDRPTNLPSDSALPVGPIRPSRLYYFGRDTGFSFREWWRAMRHWYDCIGNPQRDDWTCYV